MCTTTTHWATHISTECSTGGSGQCDGTCIEHEHECTCSCHNDWDLPQTVTEVRDWHDEANGVVTFFEKGDYDGQWATATECVRALNRIHRDKNYRAQAGQNRVVVVEAY